MLKVNVIKMHIYVFIANWQCPIKLITHGRPGHRQLEIFYICLLEDFLFSVKVDERKSSKDSYKQSLAACGPGHKKLRRQIKIMFFMLLYWEYFH